jgi:hypothetical protein
MDEYRDKRRGPIGWLVARSRAFWIVAVLVGPPLLYVVSFGPACWLMAEPNISSGRRTDYRDEVFSFYWPLGYLAVRSSLPFRGPLRWWIRFGVPDDKIVYPPVDRVGMFRAGIAKTD